MFALMCSCGSMEFNYYEEIGFICNDCNEVYTEHEAGKHLIGVEE